MTSDEYTDGADQKTVKKYHYCCKECGWNGASKFRDANRAFSALASHVGQTQDCNISWREYFVKYELHECVNCGCPLDTKTLDRCYDCRFEYHNLNQYVHTDTEKEVNNDQ